MARQARLVGGHTVRAGTKNGHLTNDIVVEEATLQIREMDEQKQQQASSRGSKCIRSFINNASKRGNAKRERSEIIERANSKSLKVGYLTFIDSIMQYLVIFIVYILLL